MVQLQSSLKEIEASGLQVVAISYDSVDILKRFADQSKIQFPLLSDQGSKVIDAYGIRNKEAKGRTDGIPHPMTFLVDPEGVIRAKLGHDDYRERHTSQQLIDAAKAIP